MSNIILGDGALGTELRSRGVEVPSHTESIWSALALTENPDEIKNIHLDYIEAGSDFITINNYAVTRPLLAHHKASICDQAGFVHLLRSHPAIHHKDRHASAGRVHHHPDPKE